MPFGRPTVSYTPLNNLADIAAEGYQDLVNIYFRLNPNGQKGETEVIKTLGFAQSGTNASLPGAVRGLGIGSFTPSTGSATGVYAAWDNGTPDIQIYLLGAGDPTTQGANARFVTNDTEVEFEQANDTLYATNGIDAVKKSDSSGTWAALASGEPLSGAGTVAKYLSWHKFMLFTARTVNAPGKLNVSDPGAPETYSGNTKTFRNKIVGLKPLGDYQMVYTEKEVWAVSGSVPTSLSFRPLDNAHPCVSHRSIVTVVGAAREYSSTGVQSGLIEHWYLGSDYVWACNGSTFRILGKDSWENFRANLSTAQLALAAAVFDDKTNQYVISVPTGSATKNTVSWAYDPLADKWVEKPFYTASCWTKHGTPTPSIYFLDSNATGKAYLFNSGQLITSLRTQLNGAHTAAVTTLTVDSTTGWPTSGVVFIDNEAISYTGVGATTFTGCIRGYQGTTAAAHSDDAVVHPAHQFRYRTRYLDFGERELIKKFQVLWVNMNVSTVAFSLSLNVNIDQQGYSLAKNIPVMTTGTTWGSFTWGAALWGAPSILLTPTNRAALSGRGKTIKLSLDEYTSIQQTEIFEMFMKLRPLKIK